MANVIIQMAMVIIILVSFYLNAPLGHIVLETFIIYSSHQGNACKYLLANELEHFGYSSSYNCLTSCENEHS